MRRAVIFSLAILAAVVALIWLNNTSLLGKRGENRPTLLAHRGLAQTYATEGLTATTCTAERIHPPEHRFIENTIDSMRAAFAAGADVVEFDIHPTTDGQFAVFHDWTLECRTEGKGVTREHSLADIKKLDAGYGYTADSGKTFPFRGSGIGQIPSLDEVLTEFPDKRFLIHIKSNDAEEGRKLAGRLKKLPSAQLSRLMVYGGALPVAKLRELLPVQTISGASLKRCLIRYVAFSWTGYVPQDCERSVLLIPANYAPWLWGWPNRFLSRMERAGSLVFMLGRHEGEDFSKGIDSVAEAAQLPSGYTGGVWTNRIDRIAPAVRNVKR